MSIENQLAKARQDVLNNTRSVAQGENTLTQALLAGNAKFLDLITSTEQGAITNKRYTDSLKDWVGQQIAINPILDLSTSQLEGLQEALAKSEVDLAGMSEATKILADAMNSELTPSLQTFQSAISADKFSGMKKALKDLPGFGDFSKGARKEITSMIGDLRKVATVAKEVGTDISTGILGAFQGMSEKSLGSVIKNLTKDIQGIAKVDIDATKFKPITDFLKSAPNKAAAFLQVKDSLALMQDAIADGIITTEEADAVTAKFNEEVGKVGPNAKTQFGQFSKEASQVKIVAQVATFVSDAWGKASASMMTSYATAGDFINTAKVAPKIDITGATKSITRLIGNFNGWISKVQKANPKVKIDITGAVKSIDRLIGDLNGIPNITRTVTIKTNRVGADSDADTMIMAHAGEDSDIGTRTGRGGSGGTGPIIINLMIKGNEIVPEQTLRRYVKKISGTSIPQMT